MSKRAPNPARLLGLWSLWALTLLLAPPNARAGEPAAPKPMAPLLADGSAVSAEEARLLWLQLQDGYDPEQPSAAQYAGGGYLPTPTEVSTGDLGDSGQQAPKGERVQALMDAIEIIAGPNLSDLEVR